MTTARTVPVTTEMDGEELDAEDAWHLVRHHGVRRVLVEAFVRFRYGDGFTNSRALALQTCLAVVPFMLAVTGLAADIDEDKPARVLAATVEAVSPGTGQDDALADALVGGSEAAGELALTIGLLFALLSMTTAMAQVERGGNRIYGIRRDRPALHKYGRAARVHRAAGRPGRPRLPAAGRRQRVRRRDGPRVRLVRGDAAVVAGAALAGRAGDARARDRGALRPRARGGGSRRCRGWPSARRSRCC